GPLVSPSSGSPGPRARTGAPTPQGSALCGPTRRSAAGTPARTADGSAASWTLLSAPTMGCPRNRVTSRPSREPPAPAVARTRTPLSRTGQRTSTQTVARERSGSRNAARHVSGMGTAAFVALTLLIIGCSTDRSVVTTHATAISPSRLENIQDDGVAGAPEDEGVDS